MQVETRYDETSGELVIEARVSLDTLAHDLRGALERAMVERFLERARPALDGAFFGGPAPGGGRDPEAAAPRPARRGPDPALAEELAALEAEAGVDGHGGGPFAGIGR